MDVGDFKLGSLEDGSGVVPRDACTSSPTILSTPLVIIGSLGGCDIPAMFIIPVVACRSDLFKLFLYARHLFYISTSS